MSEIIENEKLTESIDMNDMTVADALEQKLVVLAKDVETLIADEIERQKENLTRQIKADLRKAKTDKEKDGRFAPIQLERYREGSTLTNLEFVRRLVQMNVPKKYATVLRDEHIKLSSKEIWRIIRDNYKA